jgi:tripartite-type tricarboxylate transporter receptor subunit TctC
MTAAAYPARPIRYVVPFGEGVTAAQARWLAQQLAPLLGQPFVVETHPGKSGSTGTALVARAEPDGYTLLAANPGPLTVGPNLRRTNPYDALTDFAPVVLMATVSSVIAVNPRVAATNIGELVDLARQRPGSIRFASPGTGTVGHLALELFQHRAGIRVTHLPRPGLPEAIPELVEGVFDALIIPVPDARPLALEGAIRALGVTKRGRCAVWPELPSVAETVPGFESFNWNGIAAPAGTPPEAVDRINAAVNTVLQSPAGQQYFLERGYEIAGGTPESFGEFIGSERSKWAAVVQMAGLVIS